MIGKDKFWVVQGRGYVHSMIHANEPSNAIAGPFDSFIDSEEWIGMYIKERAIEAVNNRTRV